MGISFRNIRAVPRPKAGNRQADFRGGLNTAADDNQLEDNEVRQATNTHLTIYGGAQKRLGTRNLHTAALGGGQPVKGGFAWLRASGQQLLAMSNGTLYTATYAAPPFAWTAVPGSAFDATVYPSFVFFRYSVATECVFIADGRRLNYWDGTTLFQDQVNTPNVVQLAVYNQRLLGITGKDETIYYSPLNDGANLGIVANNGGSAIVRTFGDQQIRGLRAVKNSLLLFHVSGVSRFTGITQDDIAIKAGGQGVTSDVGTISPRSIVTVENACYFLTDRGFYETSASVYGIWSVKPMSQKIDTTLATWDHSQFLRVHGVHARTLREVWWYMPDIGILCYNYLLNAWSGPFDGQFVSPVTHSMFEAIDTNSNQIVLAGTAGGFVKQCEYPSTYMDGVLSDGTGGAAFTMQLQLKRMYMGDQGTTKTLRFLYLNCQLGAANLSSLAWQMGSTSGQTTIVGNGGGVWDVGVWDVGTWNTGLNETEYRVPASGTGRYVDVTFVDSSTNGQPLVSAIEAEGYLYGKRF